MGDHGRPPADDAGATRCGAGRRRADGFAGPGVAACAALALSFLAGCVGPAGQGGGGADPGERAGCIDPREAGDPDLARFAERIGESGWCVTERRFAAGGATWRAFEIDTGRPGPLHVVPHDDENAAFPVALHGLERMGGRAIALEAGEARLFAGRDPNRWFSDGRASAAGCPYGAPDPAFARQVLRGAGRTVIAYHSNDRGYAGDGRGGSGTVSVRRRAAGVTAFPATGAGAVPDEDAVVFVAARTAAPTGRLARDVAFLNGRNVNVVFEEVRPATDDCSLSNHLALTRGPRYFNVEVRHGDVASGVRMVDALAGIA